MNWTQLKTVLWLRWRLTYNQFSRKGVLNTVLAIFAIVFGISAAAGAGIGGIFGGALGLSKAPPQITMYIWDAIVGVFLFIWLIGVLAELQRSETIDLARLLHLPVTLQGVFFINYIVSHLAMSIIIVVPLMLGLSLGLLFVKGWPMLFMFPLVLSFIFMVTAWTYCLRGWLITLMVNPRRRRNVLVIVTLSIVLLGQAPNLYFNVYLRHQGYQRHRHGVSKATRSQIPVPEGFVTAHNYVPFLWLPNGAMELQQGDILPAALGSLGALLLGALGLGRAYRSTMRFYTGYEKAKAPRAQPVATAKAPAIARKSFVEKRVPYFPEDVGALALAFFRSMSRAPEIRISLFTNFLVIIILCGVIFSGSLKSVPARFQLMAATGAVAFTFFGLIQIMFNQFGFDREGFRSLVLSPMRRRDVLLAKNLSFAPFIFGLGFLLLLVLVILLKLPVLGLVAGLFQLGAMFLLLSMAGNFISALVPYRISAGSLKPTKPPAKVVFLIMLTQMLFPLTMMPIAIPPLLGLAAESFDILPASLVDACFSLVLFGLALFFYHLSLDAQGDFLENREQQILLVVSQENE
ncbi:MAG TPA: ABC transporter permease [Verrucomicrobiae bacterium]|nr:ABC transporter permease [Verrucomicrobiae bacterium]